MSMLTLKFCVISYLSKYLVLSNFYGIIDICLVDAAKPSTSGNNFLATASTPSSKSQGMLGTLRKRIFSLRSKLPCASIFRNKSKNFDLDQKSKTHFPSQFCAVYMGARYGKNPNYRQAAIRVGTLIANNNIGLVYGGADSGLMAQVARSYRDTEKARNSSDKSYPGYIIGVLPKGNLIKFESESRDPENPLENKLIQPDTMSERKRIMYDHADYTIALPGGTGTMEEIIEIISWKKLGHHEKPIVLVNVAGYWDDLDHLVKKSEREGFMDAGMSEKCYKLVDYEDSDGGFEERMKKALGWGCESKL